MAEFGSAQELCDALDGMVAGLQSDDDFRRRIARAGESLGIVVPSIGAEYTIVFRAGEITGASGGADESSIAATMSAETLDGIFSGRRDAETAYMAGEITLRGDEWVGEKIAGYLWCMTAAYRQATQ